MKKKLLILVTALCFSFEVRAQAAAPNINVVMGTITGADNSSGLDVNVPDVAVGSSVDQIFTIENTGTADLHISDLSIVNGSSYGNYKVSSLLVSILAPGATTTFTVTYSPYSVGNGIDQSVAFVITCDDDGVAGSFYYIGISGNALANTSGTSPTISLIKGTATGPIVDPAYSVTIPGVAVGSSADQVFTIKNTGNADLHIRDIQSIGTDPEFSISYPPQYVPFLAPGATTTFIVTFTPTSVGNSKEMIFYIISDDPGPSAEADISIETNAFAPGTAPHFTITEGSASGPAVISNSTITLSPVIIDSIGTTKIFTIKNTGNADLWISRVDFLGSDAGDFYLDSNPVSYSIISPGYSTTLSIDFEPTSSIGTKTGTIYLETSDPNTNSFAFDVTATATNATTATNTAIAIITFSKLYPNPVSDQATLELNLVEPSEVKVTLSDMMGKEVMVIANGSMSSLNESFSINNLAKGVYTVSYFINGSAAKAQLLMVK